MKTKPLLLPFLLLLAISQAAALQQLVSLQGKIDYNGVLVRSGNLTVTIHDAATGGNLIYNSTKDFDLAIVDGYFDVMLGSARNLSLENNKVYYLDLAVNGTDLDWSSDERKQFQSPVGTTFAGSFNITQNLTLSGEITGAYKKELAVENIGDVTPGQGMVVLMHFNNDTSVGEKYNNSNGTIIYDYSNAGNNGTLYVGAPNSGNYNLTVGMYSGAYLFDGKDDFVNISNSDSINFTEITIEAWLKFANTSSDDGTSNGIITRNNAVTSDGWNLDQSGLNIRWLVNGGWDGTIYFNPNIVANKWYHIAATYNSTATSNNSKLYINGLLVGTGNSVSGRINASPINAYIGRYYTGYFNGTIDEAAIYNRTLSQSEILEHYKRGFKNVINGSTFINGEALVQGDLVMHGSLNSGYNKSMLFYTQGLERARIDYLTGNVGIGTTGPSEMLEVNKVNSGGTNTILIRNPGTAAGSNARLYLISDQASSDALIHFGVGSNWVMGQDGSDSNKFKIANSVALGTTDRLTIDTSGNVGIKQTDPSAELEVRGRIYANSNLNAIAYYMQGTQYAGAIMPLSTANTWALGFTTGSTNNVSVIAWNANGNVGINRTDQSVALDVLGDIEYTGTITDVSDMRLKKNIVNITNALDKIQQIRGIYYEPNFGQSNESNENNQTSGRKQIGVIAQEVEKVLPEVVSKVDTEKGYLGVDYTQLVPVLIEAVKELKKEKDEQQSQIEQLKTENQALNSRLSALEAKG